MKCVCDTDLCNVEGFDPEDQSTFSCYDGDYDLDSIATLESSGENLIGDFETRSCFTNRNQCFKMIYKGNGNNFFEATLLKMLF